MKNILDFFPKTKALIEAKKEPTYKEKIINAIRETYSIDDEIAILRQRESKPEEFEAYFNFVEEIKANVKE